MAVTLSLAHHFSLDNSIGPQDYESTISLSTWPLLLYTRNHPSSASDSPRSIRHVSKLLTYPVTIGSVLSWVGPFGGGRGRGEGGRLTREGKRSLAGECDTLCFQAAA